MGTRSGLDVWYRFFCFRGLCLIHLQRLWRISFSAACSLGWVAYTVLQHYLDSLVVKVSALGAEDLGFSSCLHCGDFSRSSYISDFEIGAPVATLPGAWCYRVSAGTGGWVSLSVYHDWVR